MPLGTSIRRHLLTGTIALVPVSVTFWLMFVMARFVVRILHIRIFPVEFLEIFDKGLFRATLRAVFELGNFLTGFLITLLLITFVGILVRTFVGRRLITIWEGLIEKIPFVRGIYSAVKQLTEAVFMTGDRSFSRVVLIEYPRRDLYSIGFVTGPAKGDLAKKFPEKSMLNIFVPSTPNPTTGYYLILPEKDAIPLDLNAEEAFRMIISGGLSTPEHYHNNKNGEKTGKNN